MSTENRTEPEQIGHFHRLVLDGLRDFAIFALDGEGRITFWNAGAERMTGYPAEEVLGKTYQTFFSQSRVGAAREPLEMVRAEGSYEAERWWRTRDGGLVLVEERITPLEDDTGGYAVVGRNLTEARAAEEREAAGQREGDALARERMLRSELEIAERRAAFLAEASSVLVATGLNFESTIRALARLGVSRLASWCIIFEVEEQGRIVRREIAHRDSAAERQLEGRIGTVLNPGAALPLRGVLRTGQSELLDDVSPGLVRELAGFPTDASDAEASAPPPAERLMITPLHARGQVLGAVIYLDVDAGRPYVDEDLALAEELGRRAAMALDNARLYQEAQEASRAKADFLAMMSHELRTPLNAIMGYSDLLEVGVSGSVTPRQKQQIARIRASARHLLQLIEEILSFASMEDGGDELRLERITAGELVHEAAAVMKPIAAAKGLELRVEAPEDAIVLETDAGGVRQVLVNLLSNAVKFTELGSVGLTASNDGENVVFTVSDTGAGIPAEAIERIFDPFWQAERPNTRRTGGTGLGLSVSRRFLGLLHGDIDVESTPGVGSRFTVRLPKRVPVRRAEASATATVT